MGKVVDKEDAEKSIDAYNHFFGADVCLPDEQGIKSMSRFINSTKDNDGNPRRS